MPQWNKYQRKGMTEMRPVTTAEVVKGLDPSISITDEDKTAGSPKRGDMIARNNNNYKDKWLVAEEFFNENYVSGPYNIEKSAAYLITYDSRYNERGPYLITGVKIDRKESGPGLLFELIDRFGNEDAYTIMNFEPLNNDTHKIVGFDEVRTHHKRFDIETENIKNGPNFN